MYYVSRFPLRVLDFVKDFRRSENFVEMKREKADQGQKLNFYVISSIGKEKSRETEVGQNPSFSRKILRKLSFSFSRDFPFNVNSK